jgi:hypothetical protein
MSGDPEEGREIQITDTSTWISELSIQRHHGNSGEKAQRRRD